MLGLQMCWTVGVGKDCRGGKQNAPTWEEIKQKFSEVKSKGLGSVSIWLTEKINYDTCCLEVLIEGGNYIVLLAEDDNVRTFAHTVRERKLIELLGDFWDSSTACQDFDLVLKIFKEFYETGDVSHDLLKI